MTSGDGDEERAENRPLGPAARRALAEARARRAGTSEHNTETNQASEQEYGGPKGPEPTRYGDWERKGISSDF